MKNRIWVGMNEYHSAYMCTQKIIANSDKGVLVYASDGGYFSSNHSDVCSYSADIYALNLKPLEIVEVIIDTDTQKYEVKRERKKGWYLTYADVQVY